MHLKRWITGLISLPFLILAINWGEHYFAILVTAAVFFSMWEYYRIVSNADEKISSLITVIGIVSGLLIMTVSHMGSIPAVACVIALNLVISGAISVFQYKNDPLVLERVKKQIQGIVYIPLLACFLIFIRNSTEGMIWIYLLLCIVFAGDTGAFYVGSYWGKHKLCPVVSPNKTIEGSIGGLFSNVIIGSLIKYLFLPELSWIIAIPFFIIIGLAGQIGDLFESELKRSSNVKDSGGLLPGHGGILDRVDALLFAAPIAYCFKVYVF